MHVDSHTTDRARRKDRPYSTPEVFTEDRWSEIRQALPAHCTEDSSTARLHLAYTHRKTNFQVRSINVSFPKPFGSAGFTFLADSAADSDNRFLTVSLSLAGYSELKQRELLPRKAPEMYVLITVRSSALFYSLHGKKKHDRIR
jgi:hypothetical protein